MIKILNKTPVRTSNNYKINDISLEIDQLKLSNYNDIEVITDENDKININIDKKKSDVFNTKIGLSAEKFYKIKITVKENQIIEKPIYIKYIFNNDVLINEIELVFEKNSKASFIFKYESLDEKSYCLNYLKQVNSIKENAYANVTVANFINDNSDSFIAIENLIEENACLSYNFIDLGGKRKISNYYTKLLGYNSQNKFKNIYLGTNQDIIDMNYFIDILGKKSVCNMEVQGALNIESKKNFKGTIDFKEGSVNAVGEENENCVILSDKANSKSLPMLLCHEENVQGSHGVSSGKIDENKLFYLMSKGLSKKDAEKLIIKANFSNIINSLEDDDLKDEINNIIEKKLGERE